MSKTYIKNWILYLVLKCLLVSSATSEEDAVVLTGIDSGLLEDAVDTNNDTRIPFSEKSHFLDGLNMWDFLGMWAKWDLALLNITQRPIPTNNESTDQAVLICYASPLPSSLEKEIQALEDVTLTFGSYTLSPNSDLSIVGMAEGAGGEQQEIFNFSFQDLSESTEMWVTRTFHVDNFTSLGPFKIKLLIESPTEGKVGFDELVIDGYLPKSAPVIATELPELPEGNSTEGKPDVTTIEPSIETNVTVGENVTAVASNVTVDGNQTTIDGNQTINHNVTGNVNETVTGNVNETVVEGNTTTVGTGEVPNETSSLSERNETTSPSSNFTEDFPSNVTEETEVNVTSIPYVTEFPGEVPQGNITDLTAGNSTQEPAVKLTEEPSGNFTGEPVTEDSLPSNPTENPITEDIFNVSVVHPIDSEKPKDPNSGKISDDYSSFSDDVGKLASVAQAIWDAFYVFLALFCACLVALVGLIVRGRCNSPTGMTTATPLQASPPTTPGPHPTASIRSTTTQATRPMQYERSV